MSIRDILVPKDILLIDNAPPKRQLLIDLAARAAHTLGLDGAQLSTALLRREELGSTGLGGGVAVPHARIPGLRSPHSILAVLQRGIEFDAVDDKPVDIVFMLLAPDDNDALKALAGISRILRQSAVTRALRDAPSPDVAYQAILGAEGQ